MDKLTDEALDLLFREARSHNAWLNREISNETLRQMYDLAKWGPTSANTVPALSLCARRKLRKDFGRPCLQAT